MLSKVRPSYRFGPYRLEVDDRLLYKDGDVLALPPKVFDTLLLLVENAGHVVSKDDMQKQLWPDTFVEDGTLAQYISLLRKALAEEGKWIENLPRRGYRFTGPVAQADEAPAVAVVDHRSRLVRRVALGAAVAVLLIAGAVAARRSALFRPAIRSLAVLPFVNLSNDPKLEYISDGLTDELTQALMKLPGIRVAARTSAFQFRGKNEDVRKIGERLNVAAVLEGSVRVQDGRMRVTARLVDARGGHHVWSDTFEGSTEDLLTVQERIAASTARSLAREIRTQPQPAAGPNREAVLPYLQGRYFLAKGRPETFRKAIESFRDALAKDPNHARAHAGLADTYYRWALWESFPPAEGFPAARQAAGRALELDPQLAEAHASLANVKFYYDWDWSGAEQEFRRSIALDPNRADTWHWFSHLLTAKGRFAESEEASKNAIALEPFDLPSQNHLGWVRYFMADFPRAVEQHRKVMEMDPAHGQTHLLLGRALVQLRQYPEAIEQLRRNLELSPDSAVRLAALAQAHAASGARNEATRILQRLLAQRRDSYVSAYSIALVYASMGDKAATFDYLEKAWAEHSAGLVELKYEPALKDLRGEPAFQSLLKRMGL